MAPADHVGIAPTIVAIVAAALGAISLAAIAGALAVAAVLLAVIAYCRWWLYDRLVCLGGDRCAIGMLLTVEPPENKSGLDRFDTDYSINLVLAPHRVGDSRAAIETDGIQGHLIAEQAATKNENMDFKGYETRQWSNYPMTPALHCEFEGGGVQTLYDAAKAALAVAAVGSVFCFIPIIGWVVCAIAAAVAAVMLIAGIIAALNDKGDPTHVNPDLGELHTNDPTGMGADLLVVLGTWVYDSAHEGWNEIHPIKHCQRIGRWGGSWGIDAKLARDHWCEAVGSVSSGLTRDNQKRPENQWTIHPLIDGCRPTNDDHNPPVIK